MNKINYAQLGRNLVKKHPKLAKELIDSSKPVFDNFGLIPTLKDIYDSFADPPASSSEITTYRLHFIAVVVRFYDPDAISNTRRCMRSGLRKHLSDTLDVSPTQISHLFRTVKDYFQIYSSFTTRVGYFYTKINDHVFGTH